LRLPAHVARGGDELVRARFRTRTVARDDDYDTDVLQYSQIILEYESVVQLPVQKLPENSPTKQALQFTLSHASATGTLSVLPIVEGAGPETKVVMRIRQKSRQSSQFPWATEWRSPNSQLEGCTLSYFDVVPEQLFPGDLELEVEVTGDGQEQLNDVLLHSRVGWAESEVHLLESILRSHLNLFTDPEEIIHGLPMTTIKTSDPGTFAWSNPVEWGYAITNWIIMAELSVLSVPEAVGNISEALTTMKTLQSDPEQFSSGLFFPYYELRETHKDSDDYGKKKFPERTTYAELPCGDGSLLHGSLTLAQGWLLGREFADEAGLAETIASKLDFSKCLHVKECKGGSGDNDQKPWSIAMTVNAEDPTHLFPYDWSSWADEGGVVSMISALSGSAQEGQYQSMVKEQQKFSPCESWEGVTVGKTAYFNSAFSLPIRSFLGMGTLFSSPYLHDFSVRTVLPSFRAHQVMKRKIGVDYIGASDAMSQGLGSVAFFPPNTQLSACEPEKSTKNKCTWCDGVQYIDSVLSEHQKNPHQFSVPHGNTAPFVAMATMERSQAADWLEDLKLMMTDASGIYHEDYGFETLAPTKRTPLGGTFNASDGRTLGNGYFEALSHSYTTLSLYEGLASVRRRFELLKKEGVQLQGSFEPPGRYRPLSDFLDMVPGHREKINKYLAVAQSVESQKACEPSAFGLSGKL